MDQLKVTLSTWRLDEIFLTPLAQDFLKAKGQAVSGKKAELVERVSEWFDAHWCVSDPICVSVIRLRYVSALVPAIWPYMSFLLEMSDIYAWTLTPVKIQRNVQLFVDKYIYILFFFVIEKNLHCRLVRCQLEFLTHIWIFQMVVVKYRERWLAFFLDAPASIEWVLGTRDCPLPVFFFLWDVNDILICVILLSTVSIIFDTTPSTRSCYPSQAKR